MRCRNIGRGFAVGAKDENYPYDVFVNLDLPEAPIGFGEGTGFGGVGCSISLQALLNEDWTEHLRICGCEWLMDLAREENSHAVPFTPDEILGRWEKI